ncbi:VWA domain-containing protein [Candidatus Methylospira mobilis]|uniref:VWA domain-containing protein n=1 Tax=Candidatus Methylospira mobilis TaxID=1808979 RepID=A0A5Q0BJG8_9GAMM|nr:VWA domain-containing protein [Candidatus Methylospira mobilis]QFY42298.1 VWA domain-containing protein [Candidatus Methylospira mobilis]
MKIVTLLFACLVLVLSGCDEKKDAPSGQAAKDSNILQVLAGSELKDIEPLLPKIANATGITVQMRYSGTLDAVERLQSGEAVDAAWLASNRYAMLVPAVKSRIAASERTMLTPVVLGVKESKARELHWLNNKSVTWKDIADAARQGKFTFGMTDPASSNTGFSALLGLAAALSGKGDALEEKDIDAKKLASFFAAQRLTSGSSGWLAEAYLNEQDTVDGIINYASTLMSMNRGPGLKEKLVLIYPQDGIVTADYPIMLIDPARRDDYNKVVNYIRGAEFQQEMTKTTLRRPVNPDVQAGDTSTDTLVELSFPAKLAVVDAILTAFNNNLRLPTDSTFVLDRSGSMDGERMQSLKTAMQGLSGADSSISGRFARFRNRERIFLLSFSDTNGKTEMFNLGVDEKANRASLNAISASVNGLQAKGGTAIFSAVRQAYSEAAQRCRGDPSRFYSIVLMTDGENNEGIDAVQFADWYSRLQAADKGIKIFPVLFGEANPAELNTLADMTGGRIFDSRKAGLQSIFKEIRGYQ